MSLRRRAILIILDGFGVNPSKANNGVHEAHTPRLDEYFGNYPHSSIDASGRSVGLPNGQMGNSEVGHITLGCGDVLLQDLVRIDDAVEDGSIATNEAFVKAVEKAKQAGRPLHLLGMMSDGGVHSHVTHLIGLINACGERGVVPALHVITDGRDTAPEMVKKYVPDVEAALTAAKGHVATVSGRFYAMDRDNRWDRVEKAWQVMTTGTGESATSLTDAIDASYAREHLDEFVLPTRIAGGELIQQDDQVVFFNFRNDRPRELSMALANADFSEFDRGDFTPINLTTMTLYSNSITADVMYRKQAPKTTLGNVLSEGGFTQFHCSETEKYAHVTFFFNGGKEDPYKGETRKVIPSPKVETYDEAPEMSAEGVADAVIEAIESSDHDFIVVNFANGDMVGHTGVPGAVIKAVEHMDKQVGRVLDAAVKHDFAALLTADHGNCEEYIDPITKQPNTQHTVYPVPVLVVDRVYWKLATGGGISNIAPTVLKLMGIDVPAEMPAEDLLLEDLGPVKLH